MLILHSPPLGLLSSFSPRYFCFISSRLSFFCPLLPFWFTQFILVPFRLQFEFIQRALLAGKINIYFKEPGKANTNQAVDKLKHRQPGLTAALGMRLLIFRLTCVSVLCGPYMHTHTHTQQTTVFLALLCCIRQAFNLSRSLLCLPKPFLILFLLAAFNSLGISVFCCGFSCGELFYIAACGLCRVCGTNNYYTSH